jgi:WD40 repeat protein
VSACTEIAPLVALRKLGVLEEGEEAKLAAHLQGCPACLALGLEPALEAASTKEIPAPEGAWARIEASLATEAPPAEARAAALPVTLVCTYCKGPLEKDARVHCAACLAPYHGECFTEHGRCSIAGCPETRIVYPTPAPALQPARAARSRLVPFLVLLTVGGGAAAAWQESRSARPPVKVAHLERSRTTPVAPGDPGWAKLLQQFRVTPGSKPIVATEPHGGRTVQAVRIAAFGGDGKSAVVLSSENTLAAFDLETGTAAAVRDEVVPRTRDVSAGAFAPGGGRVVAGGSAGELTVLAVPGGEVLVSLTAGQHLASVAVSPRGDRALSATASGRVILWDLTTGAKLLTIEALDEETRLERARDASYDPRQSFVGAVAFSPDEKTAVTLGRTLIQWDLGTGAALAYVDAGTRESSSGSGAVAFLPDGKRVIACSNVMASPILWDLEGREAVALGAEDADALAVSPDGKHALTVGHGSIVRLWDLAARREVSAFEAGRDTLASVAFAPDGRSFVVGSIDATLLRYGFDPGGLAPREAPAWATLVRHFPVSPASKPARGADGTSRPTIQWVSDVAFSADGSTALALTGLGTLCTFKLDADSAAVRDEPGADPVVAAFSGDGSYLLTGARGELTLTHLPDMENGRSMKTGREDTCLAVSRDGAHAMVGTSRGELDLVDLVKGERAWQFGSGTEPLRAVALSPDGKRAATLDRTLRLWDLETGGQIDSLDLGLAKNAPVTGEARVAFSADGRRVIGSGGALAAPVLWDPVAKSSRPFPGASAIALSPDGQRALAVDGKTGVVRLQDGEGRELAKLEIGGQAAGRSVAFSPDGSSFLVGADDASVRFYRLAPGWQPKPSEGGARVVRFPANAPEYAVIGTCPDAVLEDYARFVVLVRAEFVKLVESGAGKIPWRENPCKMCQGHGDARKTVCVHCAGTGREPSNVYVAASHAEFSKVTGLPEGVAGYYMPAGNFEFYEHPVVIFHDPGDMDQSLRVLAHEATHQIEDLAWKGEGGRGLMTRPAWLSEGLAVSMGDGLDLSRRAEGVLGFQVPKERLAALKRSLAARAYPLREVLSAGIPQLARDPVLYAYSWSLVQYMTRSGEKLVHRGRTIDLDEAFGRFFLDNCEAGALETYPSGAYLGLAKAMGVTDPDEAGLLVGELEEGWKRYVDGLE